MLTSMEHHKIYLGVLLAALAAGGATACTKPRPEPGGETATAEKEPFGELTIDQLAAQMEQAKAGTLKLAIFDNNHRERFDKSHIAGARWVAFDKITANDLPADKDTELVFYCANEH